MKAQDINTLLREVMIQDLGYNQTVVEESSDDTLFADINTDSLGIAQLALAMEDRLEREGYKIDLVDADYEHAQTIGQFATMVAGKFR